MTSTIIDDYSQYTNNFIIPPDYYFMAYLDSSHRTHRLQSCIDNQFYKVVATNDAWGFNGQKNYNICGIDETKLIQHLIESYPDRKTFYFLDVGSGQHQWLDNLKEIICENTLVDSIRYHIVGVSGEPGGYTEDIGNCRIYKLGAFKVENMLQEFNYRDLNFVNKFDLIVSAWTMTHLVDPLGTLLQMYKLASPNSFIIGHSLEFVRIDQNDNLIYQIQNLEESSLNIQHFLQKDLQTKYLMCPDRERTIFPREFIIQKNSSTQNIKDLTYHDDLYYTTYGAWSNIADCHAVFKSNNTCKLHYHTPIETIKYPAYFYYGDEELFNFLADNISFKCMKEYGESGKYSHLCGEVPNFIESPAELQC